MASQAPSEARPSPIRPGSGSRRRSNAAMREARVARGCGARSRAALPDAGPGPCGFAPVFDEIALGSGWTDVEPWDAEWRLRPQARTTSTRAARGKGPAGTACRAPGGRQHVSRAGGDLVSAARVNLVPRQSLHVTQVRAAQVRTAQVLTVAIEAHLRYAPRMPAVNSLRLVRSNRPAL